MTGRHWRKRVWYAEDIAAAMEALDEGAPLWAVAIAYGTTVENLGHQLTKARKHGFSAFPLRSQARWRRLLKPPAVSGKDARRFTASLSLTA